MSARRPVERAGHRDGTRLQPSRRAIQDFLPRSSRSRRNAQTGIDAIVEAGLPDELSAAASLIRGLASVDWNSRAQKREDGSTAHRILIEREPVAGPRDEHQ